MKKYNNKNKIVLITGASGDIGIGLCNKYVDLNYIVIAHYNSNNKQLKQLKKEKGLNDNQFVLYKADYTEKEEVVSMFDFIKDSYNCLDILINNAGVISQNLFDLEKGDIHELKTILDINIVSQFLCGKLACDIMKNQNKGIIVNISSLAGHLPNYNNSFYSISKAGLEMLTKCMALEWAKYNIQVNCISPGAIESSMARKLYNTSEKMDNRIKGIPLKKLVSMNSVINTIVFLTSGDNDDITGTNIVIDGGSSISYFKLLSEII